MFAVVSTGGKQYKVAKGDVIQVEKVEHEEGATVTLDKVLMIGEGDDVQTGSPLLAGCSVICEVDEQFKGKKIIIFKKKRRKGYRKKNGHRQLYTRLKIIDIAKN